MTVRVANINITIPLIAVPSIIDQLFKDVETKGYACDLRQAYDNVMKGKYEVIKLVAWCSGWLPLRTNGPCNSG